MASDTDQVNKGQVTKGVSDGQLDRYARLLDAAVRVPGTNFRIGLEGLIGLIPGFGDLAGAALSSYIIIQAARMGASKPVLGRMVFNVLLETVIGAIPVLGDLFDFAFKANLRNVRLLEAHQTRPKRTRRISALNLVLTVVAVLGILFLAGWLMIWLLGSLWNAIEAV